LLDRKSEKVLKYLLKHKCVRNSIDICNAIGRYTPLDILACLNHLADEVYIKCDSNKTDLNVLSIEYKGKIYFELRLRRRLCTVYPYVISTLALLISLVTLYLKYRN
jgi:hypothetical protein